MARKLQLSIRALVVAVSVLAIAMLLLKRAITPAPYSGPTHNVGGTTFYNYVPGSTLETAITSDVVAKSPAWNPADANPPLSARDALRLADQLRKETLRDNGRWEWGLDSLALLPLDAKNRKWCWKVQFTALPTRGGFVGQPPEFGAYVLMDGKVVVPKSSQIEFLEETGLMPKGQEEKN